MKQRMRTSSEKSMMPVSSTANIPCWCPPKKCTMNKQPQQYHGTAVIAKCPPKDPTFIRSPPKLRRARSLPVVVENHAEPRLPSESPYYHTSEFNDLHSKSLFWFRPNPKRPIRNARMNRSMKKPRKRSNSVQLHPKLQDQQQPLAQGQPELFLPNLVANQNESSMMLKPLYIQRESSIDTRLSSDSDPDEEELSLSNYDSDDSDDECVLYGLSVLEERD